MYWVTTDVTDPSVARFIERDENAAAVEAHSETEHFRAFEAALPDLLAGEPEAHQFEVASTTELDR